MLCRCTLLFDTCISMKGEDTLFQLLKFLFANGWMCLLHDAIARMWPSVSSCPLPSALLLPSFCSNLGGGFEEILLQYSSWIFGKHLRTLVFICDSYLSNVTVCYCSTWYYLVKHKALQYTILESWLRNRYYVCIHLLLLKWQVLTVLLSSSIHLFNMIVWLFQQSIIWRMDYILSVLNKTW